MRVIYKLKREQVVKKEAEKKTKRYRNGDYPFSRFVEDVFFMSAYGLHKKTP
jgi:hypothetical protein